MSNELVTIASFGSLGTARFYQSLLREHGIRSFIPDEQAAALRPTSLWSETVGGIRLQVLPSDEQRATAIIEEAEAEMPPEPESAEQATTHEIEDRDEETDDADWVPIEEEDEVDRNGEFLPPPEAEEELSTTPVPFSSEKYSGVRFVLGLTGVALALALVWGIVQFFFHVRR